MINKRKIVCLELLRTGSIERNWCLDRKITRLSDIIYVLVGKGLKFEDQKERNHEIIRGSRSDKGYNYIYKIKQTKKNLKVLDDIINNLK